MKPDQVASHLRHIATKIDNSKSPDVKMVGSELRKVVASIEHQGKLQNIAREIIHLAMEEGELGYWDMDEAKRVDQALDLAKEKEKAPDIESALKNVKRQIDHFIDYIQHGEKSDSDDDSDVVTSAPKV